MELKRAIYDELLKWKQRNSGKVLELKGARQAGKTYIIDKFANEETIIPLTQGPTCAFTLEISIKLTELK